MRGGTSARSTRHFNAPEPKWWPSYGPRCCPCGRRANALGRSDIAGKTGTTNDAKDVWFIGYSSTIVAGCYIGYDQPRGLGDVSGGGFDPTMVKLQVSNS